MPGWPTDAAVKRAKQQLDLKGITTENVRSALYLAGLPRLVSHVEVRQILGTRNPRLPAGVPDPAYEDVGGRKLWLRDDIEAFAVEFKARPHVASRRAS